MKTEDHEEMELLKIGELAALAGVSVKALRVYEKKNVIKPVFVDEETGYRYYSPDQLQQIESLLELQDMGFTLKEISRTLSGKCTKEELATLFEAKQTALQEIIWKTEGKMRELDIMKTRLGQGSEVEKLRQMTDEERAWYLAKLVRVNEENVRRTLSEVLWL